MTSPVNVLNGSDRRSTKATPVTGSRGFLSPAEPRACRLTSAVCLVSARLRRRVASTTSTATATVPWRSAHGNQQPRLHALVRQRLERRIPRHRPAVHRPLLEQGGNKKRNENHGYG